jgi:tetratricopeptide (TPR) repeat protein
MPTVAEVLALGLDHHRAGRRDHAERAYLGVIEFDPDQSDAHYLLGQLAHERGRHAEALDRIGRAISIDSGRPEYRRNLARVLAADGRIGAATAEALRALALDPGDALTHHFLARLLREMGGGEAVRTLLRWAVTLDEGNGEAWLDLGIAAREAGATAESIAYFRRAVTVQPDLIQGWFNLGCALIPTGAKEEAMEALRRVTETTDADPALAASAEVELGKMLFADGDLSGAIARYEAATKRRPDDREPALLLVQSRYLTAECSPTDYLASRREWARRFTLKPLGGTFVNSRDPERRLRVGYVGGNQLNGNTAAVTILPLVEAHDRDAVEVVLYSDLPRWGEDPYTARYRASAALWRDTRECDDGALAAMIRGDRIDVLVDVFGHMSGMRFMVWGARPAPVQMAAIVTGTTGQDAFDAVVADPILLPPAMESDMAEAVAHVPLAYLYRPSFAFPECGPPPIVARGHVTFGSFNQLAKLSLPCLVAWSTILARLPSARLIIKGRGFADAAVRRRFLNLFSACGVTADRLDLRPWTDSFVGHLASFGDCDIVLDSFPYNGVTTTCEALAMGVPVIALAGDRIAGRYGATLLSAIGLEENIAGNEVDYVERALMQARDCARLARLRKELPARLWASPLANPRALAEALEDVYRQAWRRWVHADRR